MPDRLRAGGHPGQQQQPPHGGADDPRAHPRHPQPRGAAPRHLPGRRVRRQRPLRQVPGVVVARPQTETEELRVGGEGSAQVRAGVLADAARRGGGVVRPRHRGAVGGHFRIGEEQGEADQAGAQGRS